ncbi:MAG: hypothetical protein U0670_04105 [Anaerolineae bacterium]
MNRTTRLFLKAVLVVSVLAVLAIATAGAAFGQTADVTCTGSLANQLNTVGQTGRLTRFFSTLRATPAGVPILYVVTPAEFVVAAPPDGGAPVRCAAADGVNLYFVYIQYTSAPYAGSQGWANESQVVSEYGANQYWLEPFTVQPPTPTPPPPGPDCSLSLPNQLNTVGQTGSIVERFSTLRSAPGGAAVAVVDAPASFTVAAPADGGASFRCAGGFVYVYIQYTSGDAAGQTGWALESERVSVYGYDKYWIAP